MKHILDDNRELLNQDGTAFSEEQRFSHFDYLENKHKYERQYPSIEEQLDMIYWDKVNGTNIFVQTIADIKASSPKTDTSDMSSVTDNFGN